MADRARIEAAAEGLVGKALWACRRAADMATFQFGGRTPTRDYYGMPGEVGEYALHVQCPWRITRGDGVVVGARDLYYPAGYRGARLEMPEDFDWDRQPSRRDELVASLFEDGARGFVVLRVEVGAAGRLHVSMSDDVSLDVLPDDSISREHWRLFRPGVDEPHLVFTGTGIEPQGG